MSDFLDPNAPQTQQFGSLIDDLVQKTIEASPIEALVADHMVEQKQKTTQAIASSIETNPDEYARYMRLSQKSGLDPEMLRTDPGLTKQVEQDQKLGSIDIATMQRMSPTTAKFMSEPYNAAVAHDDISNLSFIEMVLDTAGHNIKEAAKLPRSIAGGVVDFASGVTGLVAASMGQAQSNPKLPKDLGFEDFVPGGAAFNSIGEILRRKLINGNFDQSAKSAETWLLDKQKQLNKTADVVSGKTGDESFGYGAVLSGARSFGMMTPTLVMSALGGALKGGLATTAARTKVAEYLTAGMALTAGGLTYGEGEKLPTNQRLRYAVEDTMAEWITEKLSVGYLFSDAIFKQSLAKAFINFNIREGLTEQAATAWQDLNKWVNLEPDKPLIDYIKARPSAALQTAIATVVAGGLQVGVVKIGERFINTKATNESKDFFDALAAGVNGSKLQTRLPEKMQEFIATAKETGGIKEVFIDAGAFQKYFQDNNLSPEVAATELLGNEGANQLNEAAARGGDFVIPIEVFAAKVAGSPHYGGLVNDLRLRQGDASVNDIAAYEAEAKQQAPAAEQIQQAQAAENEVVNKLYDSTYQEAVAVGIPVASAEAWASIQAESYRTRAARLGVDAAELYKQENQEVVSKQETTQVPEQEEVSPRFHPAIESLANDLTEGGGGVTLPDNTRSQSLNPDWFKNGAFTILNSKGNEATVSVKEIKTAVDAYKNDQPITPKQEKILQALSDVAQNLEDQNREYDLFADAETLTEEESLNGLKFSKSTPKVLYRGMAFNNKGSGIGSLGKGLYTSTSKKFAAKFGEVKEISLEEAYPKNPLILPTNQGTAQDTFTDWVLQNSDFKNIREFNTVYPDPGKFVQEQGYDGIIAGDEIVKYSQSQQSIKGLSNKEIYSKLSSDAKKLADAGTLLVRNNIDEVKDLNLNDALFAKTTDATIYYHGSPSGDLRGGKSGLHLGTREAAKQALEARIGSPAEGEWDGTREYGKTLLAGRKRLKERGTARTGQNAAAGEENYYPTKELTYADGSVMPMSVKPNILPYTLNTEMTNSRYRPHDDFKANGYMRAQLKKGTAKRGYYYENIGEDSGSISVVVPNGDHVTLFLGKLSNGLAGVEGLYNQSTDTLYLFSDNINEDNFDSVISHELFHRALAVDPKLKAATERFDADFQARFDDAAKGIGSEIELAAYKRVIVAKTPLADQQEEFKAYIVTEYQKNPKSLQAKLIKVIKDWIAAIKIALVKYGMDFKRVKSLTPADLLAMSRYGSRVIAENEVSAINTLAMASKQGYEGTDAGEAFEWLRAKAKGLDVSQEGIKNRAKKAGFDITHKLVHVSPHVLPKELSNDKTLYLSDNFKYAERYANPSASSMGGKSIDYFNDTTPTSTPVYIKKDKIFDTRKAKDRRIFNEQFLNKWGNGTPLMESGLPDWVEAEDFREFFEENELDYDGVVVDEGGDPNEQGGVNKRGLSYAIFNPSAVRSIFSAFDPDFADSGNLLASAKAERFYSALRRGFLTAPDKIFNGSAQQVKLWLAGNMAKIGVKADEIYWTGLNDFLDIKGKEKVSKQDVLDFLDANAVQVKDVVLGDNKERIQELEKIENQKSDVMWNLLPDSLTRLQSANIPIWASGTARADLDSYAKLDNLNLSKEAYDAVIDYGRALRDYQDAYNTVSTKYANSNYVVPGGKDAKELVVTIPTVEKWNESDATHYGDVGEGKQVAWIRMDSRTDSEGNEGIFVNEFQSQRGQKGRTEGFGGISVEEKTELKKLEDQYAKMVMAMDETNSGLYDIEGTKRREILKKIQQLTKKQHNGIPPAPFITNASNKATDAYITLLMKKAVSAAIDEGKTFVAWTTGSQQADFYDLSKQVDGITAWEDDGLYTLTVGINGNPESTRYDKQTPEQLEAIVGKDLAKKIVNNEGEKLPRSNAKMTPKYYYTGDNLKVGGEWTAKMYGDENGLDAQGKSALITQAANDIARKFGGKVSSVEINDTTKTLTRSGEFRVLDENGDLWNTLRDEADAVKYIISMKGKKNLHIESNVPTMRQPALIITPLMRDKILNEGMPLFSMAAPNAEDNLNEFVNKLGRTWLDNLRTDSLRSDTTEQLTKDWRTIAEHLGVPEDSFVIPDEAYGKFSNDIASFFTTGDAPHAALKRVFHKIRAWMLSIYKRKPDSLSPEVRDVFNRMILIDDAVMRARAQAGYAPAFSSPEQAGMTEAEFKAYVQGTVDDRQENLDSMTEKVVKRLAKAQDQERAAAYKVIVGDIRDKLLQENVTYRILADLKDGATVGIKLGTQSIIDVGGEAALVPLKGFYKADGELDPDTLAQAYGIRSGKAMLDDMVAAKPLDERVKEMADAAMSAQYGDPLNPDELTEQALVEIHSERRADILATELRILKRKKNETDKLIAPIVQDAKRQAREGRAQLSTSIPQAIIKDIAQQEISNTPVNRLRPHSYLLAETKAGREAAIAAANQQWGKAAEAKQKQILNFQFYREAISAQKEIDVRTRRINKMLKPKARARIGLTGQDWLEQFDGLAGKHEFAPMPVNPKTQTMAQWAASIEATTGEMLALSNEALDEANKTPYKQLTINEFRGVTDSLAAIHHVANKIQKVKGADHEYVLHEVAERLAQQIRDFIPRHEMPVIDADLSTIGEFTQFGKDLIDTNLRPEKLFERMDNGKSGLFHDIFWNPAADAQFKKDDLLKEVMKPIVEFQKEHPDHGSTMKDAIDWPLMNQTITRQVAIGMALNSGNAGNKAKMQDGGIYFGDVWHPIDDAQLQQVLDQLNETDWQLVDTLWQAIAKYKEPLNDLNMRAVGLPLTMVEPTPVVTKFGTLDGGYWPAAPDSRHSKAGELMENKSGTAIGDLYTPKFPKAATSHSFREQRTGAVYSINFDWRAVLATHVQQAALDIAYHEWIKQSDRILNKTVVKKAIQNTFGDGVYRGLQEWLVHQANPILGGYRASQAPQSLLNAAINNVAVAALGFKAATAIGNMILAPVQASHQIKSRYMVSGLAQFIQHPVKLREFVDTLSGEMRHRHKNFDQTFSELTLRIAGQRGIRAEVAKLAMAIHIYADAITSPFLWKAKFDQERDAGKDIKEAVRLADSMLTTTQTAGAPKDLSAFERDPRHREFKMFAGPMIVMQNEMRASVAMNGGATKAFGKPEVWATMMATWIIPSMLWELVAGRGPDDDEDWLTWAIRVVGLAPMMMMPIVRDVGSALEARFLHRRPFDKSPPIIAAAYGAVAQLGELADSDGDVTEIVKALTRLLGFAGMPAGQMLLIEDYLDSVARDKYGPENLQYLIWRKKK